MPLEIIKTHKDLVNKAEEATGGVWDRLFRTECCLKCLKRTRTFSISSISDGRGLRSCIQHPYHELSFPLVQHFSREQNLRPLSQIFSSHSFLFCATQRQPLHLLTLESKTHVSFKVIPLGILTAHCVMSARTRWKHSRFYLMMSSANF